MSSTSSQQADPYLPTEFTRARVLVTVKTYPQPSKSYAELVCTAGLLDGEKWVRIYPVSLQHLQDTGIPKYSWIELDLVRRSQDFRPESYRPRRGIDEPITVQERLGTQDSWATRKRYVLHEVFDSMEELITAAKGDTRRSLATVRPCEITGFHIQPGERDWKEKWLEQNRQGDIFEVDATGQMKDRRAVRKLPYTFYYEFVTRGDHQPRRMQIEDWEIGALFWNCYRQHDGDEEAAKELVKQRYHDEFVVSKDLHLFVGTTLAHHLKAPNPFVIVGAFYPPRTPQLSLFQPPS